MSPQDIARRASGNESELFRLLATVGAKIERSYLAPAYQLSKDERRKLLQVHVKFADGTRGFFSPGGPPRVWNYIFVTGHLID